MKLTQEDKTLLLDIDAACEYFLRQYRLTSQDYFILDCSTIASSEIYLDTVAANLGMP